MTDTDVRRSTRRRTAAPNNGSIDRRGAPDRPDTRRPAGSGPQNRPSATGTEPTDVAVKGLLDIVDDKAWLRADGYLPGPDDIAVSPAQVKSLGLRRGDHVTGTARTTSRRPATLQVDTVNGADRSGPRTARTSTR